MTYPIPIVIDKTANDVEIFVNHLAKERSMSPSIVELALYKVLANVQKEKIAEYAENCISLQNEVVSSNNVKTEDKDG